MKTIEVFSWRQFLEETSKLDQWAFRGQSKSGLPLYSSLSRRLMLLGSPADDWSIREKRAIRVFKRKAHVHISDHSILYNTLRCLAMMQHHGAATRLLDFTKSPFVAAFFALHSANSDAAVYGLNTPALWYLSPPGMPELNRTKINPRANDNLEKYFLSNEYPLIWFGEPDEMDSRLVAQSGLFVIPGQLHLSIEHLLQGYQASHDINQRNNPTRVAEAQDSLLVQLILKQEMRQESIRELYRMNITHASLWPDLDGLARSMNQELEIIWQPLLQEAVEQSRRQS